MQEDNSPPNESIFMPSKKQKYMDELSFDSNSNRSKPKTQKIPDIQIKVGVQNNHYSFFNTIYESEEDDENVVTAVGLKKNKSMYLFL
jgi:hypothetical protein